MGGPGVSRVDAVDELLATAEGGDDVISVFVNIQSIHNVNQHVNTYLLRFVHCPVYPGIHSQRG